MYCINLFIYAADCRENKNDNETTRYQKKLLTIVCRKALSSDGPVDEDHRRCLTEIVEQMERDKRRDHLYAYGLYELAAEQVGSIEVSIRLFRVRSIICTNEYSTHHAIKKRIIYYIFSAQDQFTTVETRLKIN